MARPKRKPGRPKTYTAPRHAIPLKIDEAFYRDLRKYAVEHDRTVTDIAVEALKAWWSTRGARPSPLAE